MPNKPRALFIDLLKVVAAVQMVQGHTLDAILDGRYAGSPMFAAWTWARGLTAVAFLVAAGLSYYLAVVVRGDLSGVRQGTGRRVRRAAMIIGIGYALRLPIAAFGADPETAAHAWRSFLIADVLQCIGLCLLFLEAVAASARRSAQVVWAATLVGCGLVAVAPWAQAVEPTGPWAFALNYVSRQGGSLFPLVPWGGYLLLGVGLGAWALPEGAHTPAERTARRLGLAGGALVVASVSAGFFGWPYGDMLERLGSVTLACSLLAGLSIGMRRIPALLSVVSRETLWIYLAHILVVYGAGWGLKARIGPTMDVWPAILLAALLVVASVYSALLWHRFKALGRRPRWVLARPGRNS